jgi:hypothetical protein
MLLLFISMVLPLRAQIKMIIEAELSEIGKIKTMRDKNLEQILVYTVEPDQVEYQQDSSLTIEMLFNAKENTFTEINYTPQYSKTVIRLIDNSLIDSRNMYNEKDELTGKVVYKYMSSGLLERREMFFGNEKTFDEIYEYENNILKKMKYIATDGTLLNYTIYNSDKLGNITEEVKYKPDGDIDFKYEYVYDASGKCIEERIILSEKSFTSITYSYDEGRNITEKLTKDNNGKILSFNKYSYQNGLLAEEINDSKESKVRKTYSYRNNLIWQLDYFDSIDATAYQMRYYYK